MGSGIASIVPGGGGISPRALAKMKKDPIVPCIFYDGAIERNVGGNGDGTKSTVAIQIDFSQLKQIKFYGRYFVDNGSYGNQSQPWWIGDSQTSNDGALTGGNLMLHNERSITTSHSDSYKSIDVSSISGKHYLCLQLPWDYGAVFIDYLKLIYKDV